jgi:hypothetical protein
VSRLVLDSVVPSWNLDPLQLTSMRQTAAVLRAACAAHRCGFDPANDLATVVRRYHDGPALLDALVEMSVGAPSFPGVPAVLHAAAARWPPVRRTGSGPLGPEPGGWQSGAARNRAVPGRLSPDATDPIHLPVPRTVPQLGCDGVKEF